VCQISGKSLSGATGCSRGRSGLRCVLAAACLLTAAAGALGEVEYIHEDARIVGKSINSFSDGPEQACVVLGDFKLTMGRRVLSGRDAVVWIRTWKTGSVVRHRMIVYIEGQATIVEPNGTSTNDRTMLVTLYHDGRIDAGGGFSARPLKDFPLYKRARDVRRRADQPASKPSARTRPARPQAPELIITTEPPARKPPAPGKPATAPATEAPRRVFPVHFHADNLISKRRGELRTTIARGNVYLSQGDPDSDLFLELRSQSAVIYSKRVKTKEDLPTKDTRSPLSPRVSAGAREVIVGAYLEGDVVIARGERYLRGPKAYYDFMTDRALVPNAVFRTIQEQRDIPVYIRADEARILSARELLFRNAKVSTSDFYTPSYSIGARRVYLRDQVPYDERTGERLGPRSWHADMRRATFNIRGLPVFWFPRVTGDFEQGHTPLRKARVGRDGDFGTGVETQWHLFRLLGMVRPKGFRSYLDLDWYRRGLIAGIDTSYRREGYSGYSLLYGVIDRKAEDDFGDRREDIEAPRERGRLTVRHKHQLPDDWELQFELSYICDRNFMEKYFPDEFHAGKPQETLIYAKKQRDNWAVTSLLQYRMNHFDTQTESAPDLALFLLGQPLWNDRLVFFSESRAGFKRWRPDKDTKTATRTDSDIMGRVDTRSQIDMPLHFGPVSVVPYAVARFTAWCDAPVNGEYFRPYGQLGARANMHFWRVYENARSRLLDVNRLKHIITPEAAFFLGCTPVQPSHLFGMDPSVEQHLPRTGGASFGVRQRLQTHRGGSADRESQIIDWMRLDILAGFFDTEYATVPSDGRFFWYNTEYSLARIHIYAAYFWQVSDSMSFTADANYDTDRGILSRGSVELNVERDPRLAYFLGLRTIHDLDTAVGTFGFKYRVNKKYAVSFAEQYDFDFDGSKNLFTTFTITRKLPRWFAAVSFQYDQRENDLGMFLTFWPEGVSEVRLGAGRMSLLGSSGRN